MIHHGVGVVYGMPRASSYYNLGTSRGPDLAHGPCLARGWCSVCCQLATDASSPTYHHDGARNQRPRTSSEVLYALIVQRHAVVEICTHALSRTSGVPEKKNCYQHFGILKNFVH